MLRRILLAVWLITVLFSCTKEDFIPVQTIRLSPGTIYLKVGESVVLQVEVDPVNASDRGIDLVSRSENIATVDASGNIHGVALGTTYIIASAADGNIIDSCEIFVNGILEGNTGNETVSMANGYANDVYYSLDKGVVATVPRTNWDIAFQTGIRSSTIIINAGAGIKLFTFPGGDISDWSNVNINGIAGWSAMNNSDTTWSLGAFEQNALGHPDYGWGVYNAVTHDVMGDSVFIIQLQDQSYRKLSVLKKASVDNEYIFRYARLDGSEEITDTVDCKQYTGKNFIFYSFATRDEVDREPSKDAWDFLFTRYIEMVPDGTGGSVPYPVVGVLANSGVRTASLDNVDVSVTDYSAVHFVTSISGIGSDWKSFNMSLNQWTLQSNRVYFLRDVKMSVFKLVFKAFEGSATGIIQFDKTKLN